MLRMRVLSHPEYSRCPLHPSDSAASKWVSLPLVFATVHCITTVTQKFPGLQHILYDARSRARAQNLRCRRKPRLWSRCPRADAQSHHIGYMLRQIATFITPVLNPTRCLRGHAALGKLGAMAAAPGTAAQGLRDDGWYTELSSLWPGQGLSLKVDEVLYQGRSEFQVCSLRRLLGVGESVAAGLARRRPSA